jgi:hypothetical protein
LATSDYLRVSLPIDQKGRKKSPIPFSLPEEYGGFLQGFLLQEVVQIPGSLLGLLQGVEKAVKQISPIGRDQKDMGVGNPPPSRIHADEIRFKPLLKFPGYHPGHREKALGLLLREVMPPGNMPFRNHQAVALSERVDVQDSYGRLILINPVSLCFSRNDLAENTIILGRFQNALLQNEKIQKPFRFTLLPLLLFQIKGVIPRFAEFQEFLQLVDFPCQPFLLGFIFLNPRIVFV